MKTLITKTITVSQYTKPITLEYSDNDTFFGDTDVTIYDDYKISLVLTDNCGAVIGDKLFFPQRGDMMIFRPSEVHFGRFPKSGNYTFLSFFIPVDFFKNAFPGNEHILSPFLDNSPEKTNHLRLPQEEKIRLIDLADSLLALMNQDTDQACFDILAFSKLVEALYICHKCYPLQKNLPEDGNVPPLITKTIQKIDAHFPAFVGLPALAAHCGCSITYLTQTFRLYTGKSI